MGAKEAWDEIANSARYSAGFIYAGLFLWSCYPFLCIVNLNNCSPRYKASYKIAGIILTALALLVAFIGLINALSQLSQEITGHQEESRSNEQKREGELFEAQDNTITTQKKREISISNLFTIFALAFSCTGNFIATCYYSESSIFSKINRETPPWLSLFLIVLTTLILSFIALSNKLKEENHPEKRDIPHAIFYGGQCLALFLLWIDLFLTDTYLAGSKWGKALLASFLIIGALCSLGTSLWTSFHQPLKQGDYQKIKSDNSFTSDTSEKIQAVNRL